MRWIIVFLFSMSVYAQPSPDSEFDGYEFVGSDDEYPPGPANSPKGLGEDFVVVPSVVPPLDLRLVRLRMMAEQARTDHLREVFRRWRQIGARRRVEEPDFFSVERRQVIIWGALLTTAYLLKRR